MIAAWMDSHPALGAVLLAVIVGADLVFLNHLAPSTVRDLDAAWTWAWQWRYRRRERRWLARQPKPPRSPYRGER